MPVHNLRQSETALQKAAVIRTMIDDPERTIQILHIDICTEEERVRFFDKADPLYSVLARSLGGSMTVGVLTNEAVKVFNSPRQRPNQAFQEGRR
jgi:hypothetical protein